MHPYKLSRVEWRLAWRWILILPVNLESYSEHSTSVIEKLMCLVRASAQRSASSSLLSVLEGYMGVRRCGPCPESLLVSPARRFYQPGPVLSIISSYKSSGISSSVRTCTHTELSQRSSRLCCAAHLSRCRRSYIKLGSSLLAASALHKKLKRKNCGNCPKHLQGSVAR